MRAHVVMFRQAQRNHFLHRFFNLNSRNFGLLSVKMSKRKAPDTLNNVNADLCDFIIELADYERNINKNVFKYNAYRKAAATLAALSERIKSGDEAKKLPGIGAKIAKKIDEFLATGKLQKLENIRQDDNNVAINLLIRVSGIGPTKAKELVDMGIKTLEDLKKHKDKLNHHQKIGLKYFDDFEKKIPRDEITKLEIIIREAIEKVDKKYIVTVCGSYRREKSESGDIDVLITHPSLASKNKETRISSPLKIIVESLEKRNLVTDTISLGTTKFAGVCKDPNVKIALARRLDIRLVPHDHYYCAVLYFTGSDLFNKKMRADALEKKFTLNEYSLRRLTAEGTPGKPEIITSEADIFEKLNLPYKEPINRNI